MVRPQERFHAEKCEDCGGRGRLYRIENLTYRNGHERMGRTNLPIPIVMDKSRCVDCDGSGYKILAEISEVSNF